MNAEDEHDGEDRIEALRELSLDREPERDLWPAVAARIEPRRSRRHRPWLGALAASALVAAVVLQLRPDAPPVTDGEVAAVLAEPLPRAGQVMPQQDALLKANLAIVQDAESQLRHALELDPESATLKRLLLSVEQRQGDLRSRIGQQET
ncbi:hypothetical protein [Sinimarinibacterium flocculans]|uniref:Uncharacterized protein n=1 Tax=Sinimarinibacterium flocculans TaxID=985250 RepID=A0A318ELR1_9GAMM|nr:hypothetical protein [Sinimarinibacterium flocculans]PXV70170.1 hypothetical protein C8D93_10222 [Sinimarinibacterium flocculans]